MVYMGDGGGDDDGVCDVHGGDGSRNTLHT